jgi:hypothetical protein
MTMKSLWTLTLGGHDYDLVPSTDALMAIEHATGRTLYSLIEQVKGDTLSLRDLSTITTALIGAGMPQDKADNEIARDFMVMKSLSGIGGGGIMQPSQITGLIVSAGIMKVTASVITPMALAMSGKVSPDGRMAAEVEG